MSRTLRFRPRVERLDSALSPADALARLRDRDRPVLLDGAAGEPRRFSLLAFDPVATADFGSLEELRAFAARLAPPEPGSLPADFPDAFHGGFLGALAYDLGVAGEDLKLPAEPWDFPLVVGGLYTDFLVKDEVRAETWLALGEDPGDGRPPVDERRAAILAAFEREPDTAPLRATGPLVRCVKSREHRARVERARAWIAAGEMYQANVAHRFTRAVAGDPIDLYLRLRRRNPAPYMAFLRWPGGAVLSTSPELLLEFDGASARTRPIKGTIERGATPAEDAERAAALLASEKDRAELAMIVDLERNDLGRIARTGSVEVGEFPRLESFATVHHLVADVACRPRAGVDAVDALAALFPGGSITGAPKLRSMELIAELEGEGRGFFTGSLGFLDARGRAAFNILIRTLLWRPTPGNGGGAGAGEVSFRVGGGITWASDPAAEDAETLAKGRALAEALAESEQPTAT